MNAEITPPTVIDNDVSISNLLLAIVKYFEKLWLVIFRYVSSGKILFENSAISYESNMRLVIGLEALGSEMRVKEVRSYSERSRGKSTMGWGGEMGVVMGGVSFWS